MNAYMKSLDKGNNQLYKKVGRKYVRVNDPCAYDGLREGWWLVKVAPDCTSIRATVYPARAEIEAAIRDKEEELCDIIREASEPSVPNDDKNREECQKEFAAFCKKWDINYFQYPSIAEIAEKIMQGIQKK